MKAALRANNCVIPFYDALDSYEAEFKKLVVWAKTDFQSLHDVFEVSPAELDQESGWARLGLPAVGSRFGSNATMKLATSYMDRDISANCEVPQLDSVTVREVCTR